MKVPPVTPDPDVLGTSEHMFIVKVLLWSLCQGAREHYGALCMVRHVPGRFALTMPDHLCPDVFRDRGPSALAALMLTFTPSPYAFCLPLPGSLLGPHRRLMSSRQLKASWWLYRFYVVWAHALNPDCSHGDYDEFGLALYSLNLFHTLLPIGRKGQAKA